MGRRWELFLNKQSRIGMGAIHPEPALLPFLTPSHFLIPSSLYFLSDCILWVRVEVFWLHYIWGSSGSMESYWVDFTHCTRWVHFLVYLYIEFKSSFHAFVAATSYETCPKISILSILWMKRNKMIVLIIWKTLCFRFLPKPWCI